MAQKEVSDLLNKDFHPFLISFNDKAHETLTGVISQQEILIKKLELMQNHLSMSQDNREAMVEVTKRLMALRKRTDKLFQDLLKLNSKITEQGLQAEVTAVLQRSMQASAPVESLLDL